MRRVEDEPDFLFCSDIKKCIGKVGINSKCGPNTLGWRTSDCEQAQCNDELSCIDGICVQEQELCPWLQDSGDPSMMKCGNGLSCNVDVDGWDCCFAEGGRLQCPPEHSTMCAQRTCGGGDYCCSSGSCDLHGGERVCSLVQCQDKATVATCSPSCERTCGDESDALSCECFPVAPTEHECRCDDGFIRKHRGGPCVSESDCPAQLQCSDNEVVGTCAFICEASCDDRNPTSNCIIECMEGIHEPMCRCDVGFVRLHQGPSDCVPVSKCPDGK